jgi:hypothetical protein
MSGSIRQRLLVPALAIGLAGVFTAPAGASDTGQPAEPYVPWVTDFGGSPTTPAESPDATGGLDWGDMAIGAAVGFGMAAGLGATGAAVRARRNSPWLPDREEAGRVAP